MGARDVNSAETVRVAMRGLEWAGLDAMSELRRAGASIVDGGVRGGLSRAAYCALWTRMARASGRNDFGLALAEHIDAGTVGPLEWFAASARTLGEGLSALASCGRLLHAGGHYALERRRDEAAFVYYPGASQRPPRALLDWSFGYLLQAIRRATRGTAAPREVRFQYPRPPETSRVAEVLGATVLFDAPLNEIVFARDALERPLLTHDPEAHAMLAGLCRRRCAGAAADELEQRVRTALLRHLAREELPSVEVVARRLGKSARALQRGLTEHGSSFRKLVLEARMEAAECWLADPRRSIADVAYALGYSEASAFQRAYRGYFGRPCRARAT